MIKPGEMAFDIIGGIFIFLLIFLALVEFIRIDLPAMKYRREHNGLDPGWSYVGQNEYDASFGITKINPEYVMSPSSYMEI